MSQAIITRTGVYSKSQWRKNVDSQY